ncbi:MAG: PEP-CTERM sorting domain-containing protein [Planctomycetales bacterium]|nr:PEP-CTERM sorting domain-containing protein [Planctomycetales bacterium]
MRSINRSAHIVRAAIVCSGFCLAVLAISVTPTSAGTFNWGDINDPGADVMFLGVAEDNGYSTSLFAPMPGTGSPVAIGNSLMLNPQNFLSFSSNSSHAVDSEFSTTLMVGMDNSIESIVVSEFGDHTLGGLPFALATAQVGASFHWQILELDGVGVSLPVQNQNLQVTTGSGPNGGIYYRPAHNGIATPWEGSAVIDVAGYLAANSLVGDVTKVALVFDNSLLTAADQYSSAFIKKKGVTIDVQVADPFNNIPEPASLVLLALGMVAFGRTRYRV